MIRLILILSLACGCSAPVPDYTGQCVSAIAISCAIAEGGSATSPVTPAFKCARCEDEGWFYTRDTGLKQDCPECDADPLSKAAATIINDPQPTPELAEVSPPPPAPVTEPEQDAGQDRPAVDWMDWETASQLSSVTTRPVLVFQHGGKPLKFTPETMAELNKLGILCSDTAKRWQPLAKKPIAPAVAYVAHDAALGSEPPFLTDLKTDSESATLKQLKAWVAAIE